MEGARTKNRGRVLGGRRSRGGEGRNELCSAPFEQRKKKEMREREYAHGVGEGGMLGLNATYGNDRGKARRPARGGNRRRGR